MITPNPKTSGGARWNYLAAWGYALRQPGGNDAKAQEFVDASCSRTCRCSTPARAARRPRSCSAASATCCSPGRTKPTSRSRRAKDKVEIVVAVGQHPRRAAGRRRRQGRGQEGHARGRRGVPAVSLLARRARRSPRSITTGRATQQVAAKYAAQFAKVKLFTIDEAFGGWQKAQKTHFADGGTFDQIYRPGAVDERSVGRMRRRRAFCRASG